MTNGKPLPAELIRLVVACVAPKTRNEILHPKSQAFQTLLALTRASRACYFQARRFFFLHCIHLEDDNRTLRFAACLPRSPPPLLRGDHQTQPHTSLQTITSLFLGPCLEVNTHDAYGIHTWDLMNATTAQAVKEILLAVAPSLTRLVYDLPLYTATPFEATLPVRQLLRDGLCSLRSLQELISVREDLNISTDQQRWLRPSENLYRFWPELKRLAVYNANLRHDLFNSEPCSKTWLQFATLKKLETLVLVHPKLAYNMDVDDDSDTDEETDPDRIPDLAVQWWKALDGVVQLGEQSLGWKLAKRQPAPLHIVVMELNVVEDEILLTTGELTGEKHKGNKVLVHRNVPVDVDTGSEIVDTLVFPEDDEENQLVEIVKGHALRGTLFETEDLGCTEFGFGELPDMI